MAIAAIRIGAQPAPPVPGAGDTATAPEPFPPTIRDPQGRVYHRRVDPATGHIQYAHQSQQADAAGNRLSLSIVIDFAPDGTFSRTTNQQIETVRGERQRESVVARFGSDGVQLEEVVDSTTTTPQRTLTEHTVSTFTAGQVTKRVTNISNEQRQVDPKTRESVTQRVDVVGTWEDGGRPITDTTIPMIDRREKVTYRTPGQGINKDTDRTITTTGRATGPANALRYESPMKLVVRFEGRGGQYVERELHVPLSKDGTPDMANAVAVRTEDKQSGLVKALTQGRIWGGFASNILGVLGFQLLNGSLGKVGRGMMYAGVAAGAAELAGESHAFATRRNDADLGRLFMSAYDLTWLGLLTRHTRGWSVAGDFGIPLAARLGVGGAGAAGIAMKGPEMLEKPAGPATASSSSLVEEAQRGAAMLKPAGSSMPGDWRAEPRFDAAAQLGSVLS